LLEGAEFTNRDEGRQGVRNVRAYLPWDTAPYAGRTTLGVVLDAKMAIQSGEEKW